MRVEGGGGGQQHLFLLEPQYFCDIGPHAKFQNPKKASYWIKVNTGEKRENLAQAMLGSALAWLRMS